MLKGLMLIAAAAQGGGDGAALLCEVDLAQLCTSAGCRSDSRPAFFAISPKLQKVRLCINSDCIEPKADFFHDEEALVVKFPDEVGFLKVFLDGSLIDVSMSGSQVQVSHGQCREGPPPIIRVPR